MNRVSLLERAMQDMTLPKIDRHWLVYQESIETEMRQGAAGKAISEYLEALGYHQTQISPTMIYERGATLASLYHPNPKRQKTIITLDFVSSGGATVIELTMRINRFGNVPLRPDFDFWRAELDGLADTLRFGYANPRISDFAAERALWYSVVVMIGVFTLAMLAVSVLAIALMVMLV